MIMSDQTMLQRWAKKRAILKGAYAISCFLLAAPLVLFHHLNSRWQRWETSLSIQIIKDFTYKDNFIVRRIWKRDSWGRGGGGSNCDQIIQSASQIKKKRGKKWISLHFGWITFSISIPDIVLNWHFYLLESQCKTKKTVSLSLPQLIICGQSLLTLICSLQKNSFCTFVLKALWALLVVYYYFTLKMSSWGQKCGFCFCLELFSQKKKSCLLRLLLIWMVIYLYLFCVILLWRGRLIHRFSSPYENFSWIVLKHEFETVWISFFFFC